MDQALAGLMLSAILSDTRVFRSPITTEHDKRMAAELAKIAGVRDVQSFGLQMLRDYNDEMVKLSDEALVVMDFKLFNIGQGRIGIAQLEAFDASFLLERLNGLKKGQRGTEGQTQSNPLLTSASNVSAAGFESQMPVLP